MDEEVVCKWMREVCGGGGSVENIWKWMDEVKVKE